MEAMGFLCHVMERIGPQRILYGDEYGRSQRGCNNGWCQDARCWFSWSALSRRDSNTNAQVSKWEQLEQLHGQGSLIFSEVTVKKKMVNYWDLRDSWLLWGREGQPFFQICKWSGIGQSMPELKKHAFVIDPCAGKAMAWYPFCILSYWYQVVKCRVLFAGKPMLAFSTERNSSAIRTQVFLQWNC